MTNGDGIDPERLAIAETFGVDPSAILALSDEEFEQLKAQQLAMAEQVIEANVNQVLHATGSEVAATIPRDRKSVV